MNIDFDGLKYVNKCRNVKYLYNKIARHTNKYFMNRVHVIETLSQVDLLGVKCVIEKIHLHFMEEPIIYSCGSQLYEQINRSKRAQLNESHAFCEFQKNYGLSSIKIDVFCRSLRINTVLWAVFVNTFYMSRGYKYM